MKHTFKILCVSLLLFSNFSCNKMLEVDPENTATFYNFFKKEVDLESVMQEAYATYRELFSYMPSRSASGELADECSRFENLMALRDLIPADIIGDASTTWRGYYLIITQTLLVLENIDRIDMPKERYNYWMGQALFYRALAYFSIVRDWGDCPYIEDSNIVKPEARRPWQEVLDKAIKDMEKATDLLDPWATLTNSKGAKIKTKQIPGKEAAFAMLAHMYAWKANLSNDIEALQKAIDAATFVIDKGGFILAPDPEAVCTSVMAGGDNESIFECSVVFSELYSPTMRIHLEILYQSYPLQTNSEIGDITSMEMKIKADRVLNMYKAYPKAGNDSVDLRRDAYFYKPESMKDSTQTEGWALMWKRRAVLEDRETYPNYPETWFKNYGGNVIITRLAEIYLLRAECYAKQGQDDLAIDDLNQVRDRARALRYNPTEGSVYRMVFEEREKELLCERHRWYDMVRTGYWKTDMTPAYTNLTEQDVADGALFLPVDFGAFASNPLMRQNRYWERRK